MLNIQYKAPEPKIQPIEEKKYASPIGLWHVTTVGDVEGRTIDDLGYWRGHIAEIAFHLAHKCAYSLCFAASVNKNVFENIVPTPNIVNKKDVWIHLGVDSRTWSLKGEERVEFFRKFLDANDQLKIDHKSKYATYYASVYLTLKN